MRSFLAVNIGLFTALPIIIFILAAVAELALCIFALRAETCRLTGVMVIVFQNIGSKRLLRHGLPNPSPDDPFDARLQNITFGTFQCCLGFATHTDCQPLPIYLATLNIPLGSAMRIKDIYALKGIASGIIHTSLAWAIQLWSLLITVLSCSAFAPLAYY
ncbi:hypothetical protein DL95DRAFT_472781 [Leptodontidium sp. 2 PMI_412]|nr:hypothetical protein DL95DRAFT_472781 [Leptodontidium sp. 2 PMI_412]